MPERPHLAYPVQVTPGGRLLAVEQDSDREVADCIAVILNWPKGTRIDSPDFGTPPPVFNSGGPDLGEMRRCVAMNDQRAAPNVRDVLLNAALEGGVADVLVAFDQVSGEAE